MPRTFNDIAASIALLRTGPMKAGTHEQYLRRRHGEVIEYEHPIVEDVLSRVGGVLYLQEQIMQISMELCGFSASRADDLRKAAAKKKKDLMASLQVEFVDGAVNKSGMERGDATALWQKVEYMAEYLFNHSHAVSYAALGYEMAYLKTYWPMAFWSGVLTYASNDTKDSGNIYESKIVIESEGYTIQPPRAHSFNYRYFPIGDGGLHWPISGLKGITESWGKSFYNKSPHGNGSYSTIAEMCSVELRGRRMLDLMRFKTLLYGGFFDDYGKSLADVATEYFTETCRAAKADVRALDSIMETVSTKRLLFAERTKRWKSIVTPVREVFGNMLDEGVVTVAEYNAMLDGDTVHGAGVVTSRRYHKDKNGKRMMFAKVADYGVEYSLVIFSSMVEQLLDSLGRVPGVGDLVEFVAEKSVSDKYGSSIVFVDGSGLSIRTTISGWS